MQDIHLVIKLFLEQPCFEREQLDILHALLKKHLPTWSSKLVVARDEDSDEFEEVGYDGNLFESNLQDLSYKKGGLEDVD
ncbi:MAG: hypothetical protein HC936_07790 [Leptolyngbyaceae cyanobacterium SU_3_3]|nr:hypothetical protein [Leptolyngbyaceae cyanobacterium SU_3_3]